MPYAMPALFYVYDKHAQIHGSLKPLGIEEALVQRIEVRNILTDDIGDIGDTISPGC